MLLLPGDVSCLAGHTFGDIQWIAVGTWHDHAVRVMSLNDISKMGAKTVNYRNESLYIGEMNARAVDVI